MLIILTCLFCALICVVGLMAVTRCVCNCHQHPVEPATNDKIGSNKILKMKIVNTIPKRIFRSSGLTPTVATSENDTAAVCVICLDEFRDGEEVREFPACSHIFHIGCIDTWLLGSYSFSCPSCRQALATVNQCQKCRTGISANSRQQEADFLP